MAFVGIAKEPVIFIHWIQHAGLNHLQGNLMPDDRKPCDNELCDRDTSSGAKYCCDGCARADEGQYEIHESGFLGHSPGCDERHPA